MLMISAVCISDFHGIPTLVGVILPIFTSHDNNFECFVEASQFLNVDGGRPNQDGMSVICDLAILHCFVGATVLKLHQAP